VLFNEPKLLKSTLAALIRSSSARFSALQRAEIAEIVRLLQSSRRAVQSFSALQRAEIAEISKTLISSSTRRPCFSALQRAEIAEM